MGCLFGLGGTKRGRGCATRDTNPKGPGPLAGSQSGRRPGLFIAPPATWLLQVIPVPGSEYQQAEPSWTPTPTTRTTPSIPIASELENHRRDQASTYSRSFQHRHGIGTFSALPSEGATSSARLVLPGDQRRNEPSLCPDSQRRHHLRQRTSSSTRPKRRFSRQSVTMSLQEEFATRNFSASPLLHLSLHVLYSSDLAT